MIVFVEDRYKVRSVKRVLLTAEPAAASKPR